MTFFYTLKTIGKALKTNCFSWFQRWLLSIRRSCSFPISYLLSHHRKWSLGKAGLSPQTMRVLQRSDCRRQTFPRVLIWLSIFSSIFRRIIEDIHFCKVHYPSLRTIGKSIFFWKCSFRCWQQSSSTLFVGTGLNFPNMGHRRRANGPIGTSRNGLESLPEPSLGQPDERESLNDHAKNCQDSWQFVIRIGNR